ncbi:uncharacterized protein LOC6563308 [Drosophila grimshawi]|uniref:GH18249 n=1 Tax=Drosophila grimshawi TaxID=7222 RepID=B4JFK5_DROGR|nr:uncharacterized protein LOC6563308 [Drosophila grimshawi]EDV93486.1 GH18249 [Drosophila grimshawi]
MSCDQSFEDDNCSINSNVCHSTSPVQKETPIRVRDMINLYNFATQKNQELNKAKSIYFGEIAKVEEQEFCSCICNKMPDSDGQAGNSCNKDNFRLTTLDDQTSLRQSLSGNASNGESVAKSYESKTTIRRSKYGVRITIDIFHDKNDKDIDISGSRVETEIPRSRILTEFQQHSQQVRQSPNV